MILSDRDIRARLGAGDLEIEPIEDLERQLQPASVDLRLADTFVAYELPHIPCIDPREPETISGYTSRIRIPAGEAFVLHPGEFALGRTMERVRIPGDLVARVEGRSSYGRLAIVVHATAGFIDPGFDGTITLELSNLGRAPVKLYPGERISQLVLQRMTSAAERPYGADRGSKYQGQVDPEPSRVEQDDR